MNGGRSPSLEAWDETLGSTAAIVKWQGLQSQPSGLRRLLILETTARTKIALATSGSPFDTAA